ncbi:MAG: VOC family protein [Thermoanaerobaculia bacterium]
MTGPQISRIGQVAVIVNDVDRATAFYRDVVGLPFLFSAPPGLAFFDCAGTRLMLSKAEGTTTGTSVLYFMVDDIRTTHAAMSERGVVFRDEPHLIAKLADREVWMAFFSDSEGNLMALMSEPRL